MTDTSTSGDTWKECRAATIKELRQCIDRIARVDGSGAWRGSARREWLLESTLDRLLKKRDPNNSYENCLALEQGVIAQFKQRSAPYMREGESQQLLDVWTMLAVGQHAGLATRLLDWTRSPWVAAWFACHEHSDTDGAMWWFRQQQLESVVHAQWDQWGVPTRAEYRGFTNVPADWKPRLGLDQRALEATAFNPNGKAWISKIHYPYPCSRMDAQQGFMTACGRLRTAHNKAIDDLPGASRIARGRIIVSANMKGELLSYLRTMNIHAKSLEYPGVDIVARSIGL